MTLKIIEVFDAGGYDFWKHFVIFGKKLEYLVLEHSLIFPAAGCLAERANLWRHHGFIVQRRHCVESFLALA
jgi:hypothetical protein